MSMINYETDHMIRMEEGYDIAQICHKGHVINSCAKVYPQFNQKFCQICGSATTTSCLECHTPIRGSYLDGLAAAGYKAPAFCINCGCPFPWTQTRITAALELAQDIDTLSEVDKALLKQCIDDLITDSPFIMVAITRLKKIMTKAGPEAALLFREILMDVTPESVWAL